MAQFPAMPLWTDAYLADTTHLTTFEHGAYLKLLIAMWRSKGRLPNDDKFLAKVAGCTNGQWARIKPTMMAFMRCQDSHIAQARLTDELKLAEQHRKSQSFKARARWLKTKETGDAAASERDMPNASRTHAPLPLPSPLPSEEPPVGPPGGGNVVKLAARATPIPQDYTPSDKLRAWAKEKASHIEVGIELGKFLDHAQDKGRKSKSPEAAFRSWLRKAEEWAVERQPTEPEGAGPI